MVTLVRMPKSDLTMKEGTILTWYKTEGPPSQMNSLKCAKNRMTRNMPGSNETASLVIKKGGLKKWWMKRNSS